MSALDYTVNWTAAFNPNGEVLKWASFDDVLLVPQKTSLKTRADADISVDFLGRKLKVPFLSAPMPTVTGTTLAIRLDKLGGLAVLHRFQDTTDQAFSYFDSGAEPAVAIGIHDGLMRTSVLRHQNNASIFVLDVAHAHSDPVIEFVKKWKNAFGFEAKLVVGNVATGLAALDLVNAGADAIKVGIGPGSVCTTRQVTGFGIPQLHAINEVKFFLHGRETPIIADGGIRNSGDIVKALAAGADVVMIGSLFAHSDEAPNMGTHYGCASDFIGKQSAPEGTIMDVVGKEPLDKIVNRLAGGLRSGVSYGGATSIAELRKKAQWVRLTDAGRRESKL